MVVSGQSHPLLPLFLIAAAISFMPIVVSVAFDNHGVLKTAVSEYCDDAPAANTKYGWVLALIEIFPGMISAVGVLTNNESLSVSFSASVLGIWSQHAQHHHHHTTLHIFLFCCILYFTNSHHPTILYSYPCNDDTIYNVVGLLRIGTFLKWQAWTECFITNTTAILTLLLGMFPEYKPSWVSPA